MGLRHYFVGLFNEGPAEDQGSHLQGILWLFALHPAQLIWFVLGTEGFILMPVTQVIYGAPLALFFALRGRNLSAWGVVLGGLLTALLAFTLLPLFIDPLEAIQRLGT